MGAVQSRMHFSMKQEFKLLKTIIADYAPEEYSYQPEDGDASARKSDYDNVDVIPVSDPNAATMAQKVVQYQAAMQLAQSAPQLYNLPLLHRQMLDVLGIKNTDKLVPMPEDMMPVDPVHENQNLLTNKPVKAFIEQNHQAHIQAHMSFIQNPKIQQMIQQNPQSQMFMSAALAHINEHVAFQYRIEVQQSIGMPLPPMQDEANIEQQKLPPQISNQIAMMAAQASQQLFMRDQQQMQQQQAQQQMQDPVVQMQMQELQLKQQDLQLKAQKQQMEAAEKAQRLQVEQARIATQKEIAAMQVAASSTVQKEKMLQQAQIDSAKIRADLAKHKNKSGVEMQKHNAQMAFNRIQSMRQPTSNKDKT
jgi:hypothetical protein